VYFSDENKTHSHGIYCALIPALKIEDCLADFSWDFNHGEGMPGAIEYCKGDSRIVEYLRYGCDNGIEPLVIDRNFHGMRDNYIEISEEFRLFHRLYYDRKQDRYFKCDCDGNEHLVVIVEPNRVQIRLKEIREFLAIKEMFLSIQFDHREHSEYTLEELDNPKGSCGNSDIFCWRLSYGDMGIPGTCQAFSRLLGKHLILPLPKEKSGFWGFAKEETKKYVDFIINVNQNGDKILHTSNPGKLADYFGANPGSPQFLTPVQFSKQVLDKYYQQPSKYSVESGVLRCGSLWIMYIDNHFDDRVAAWLGDLGSKLPYEEQLHWRSFNIDPVGGVSETYFRRQILAQPTDSDRPEHEFQRLYDRLHNVCNESLGWQILFPLAQEDAHYFQAIRIPSTDEQKDFDELILALAKILVDSLNERRLRKLISSSKQSEIKGGISRLENALKTCGFSDYEEHIEFLRNLQSLRSTGAAHCKGRKYQKIAQKFNVNNQSLVSVFQGILVRGIKFVEFLESTARSGKFVS
jgi:hypothetical protein